MGGLPSRSPYGSKTECLEGGHWWPFPPPAIETKSLYFRLVSSSLNFTHLGVILWGIMKKLMLWLSERARGLWGPKGRTEGVDLNKGSKPKAKSRVQRKHRDSGKQTHSSMHTQDLIRQWALKIQGRAGKHVSSATHKGNQWQQRQKTRAGFVKSD